MFPFSFTRVTSFTYFRWWTNCWKQSGIVPTREKSGLGLVTFPTHRSSPSYPPQRRPSRWGSWRPATRPSTLTCWTWGSARAATNKASSPACSLMCSPPDPPATSNYSNTSKQVLDWVMFSGRNTGHLTFETSWKDLWCCSVKITTSRRVKKTMFTFEW